MCPLPLLPRPHPPRDHATHILSRSPTNANAKRTRVPVQLAITLALVRVVVVFRLQCPVCVFDGGEGNVYPDRLLGSCKNRVGRNCSVGVVRFEGSQ